jgi:hypothetical protein
MQKKHTQKYVPYTKISMMYMYVTYNFMYFF